MANKRSSETKNQVSDDLFKFDTYLEQAHKNLWRGKIRGANVIKDKGMTWKLKL